MTRLVPMAARIYCPICGTRHVDEGEWQYRAHHTHLCARCGAEWRVEGKDGLYFYGCAEPTDPITDIHTPDESACTRNVITLSRELDAERQRADAAEAVIAAVHERVDEAGGVPNRDERGELTLLQRVDMLAKDCDVFEREIMRRSAPARPAPGCPRHLGNPRNVCRDCHIAANAPASPAPVQASSKSTQNLDDASPDYYEPPVGWAAANLSTNPDADFSDAAAREATKWALPVSGAKLTPEQEANERRDVTFEDAAENEGPRVNSSSHSD